MFRMSFLLWMSVLFFMSCSETSQTEEKEKEEQPSQWGKGALPLTCSRSSSLDHTVNIQWNMYDPLTSEEISFALFERSKVMTLIGQSHDVEVMIVKEDGIYNMIMYPIDGTGARVLNEIVTAKFPCPQQCQESLKKAFNEKQLDPGKFCHDHIEAALIVDTDRVNYLAVRHFNGFDSLGIYGVRYDSTTTPVIRNHYKQKAGGIFKSND